MPRFPRRLQSVLQDTELALESPLWNQGKNDFDLRRDSSTSSVRSSDVLDTLLSPLFFPRSLVPFMLCSCLK